MLGKPKCDLKHSGQTEFQKSGAEGTDFWNLVYVPAPSQLSGSLVMLIHINHNVTNCIGHKDKLYFNKMKIDSKTDCFL